MWPQAKLRRSREQCKSACNCLRRDSICGPQGPNCAEAESNASLLAIASGATVYAAALSLAVMLAVDFSVICTAHAINFLIKKRDLVSLYP